MHVAESAIERTYKKYYKGGSFKEVALKKPMLCFGAIPTIFPSKIPRKKQEYAVKIVNAEISNEQRNVFAENRNETRKRKLESESVLEGETPEKQLQLKNTLHSKIVDDFVNGVRLLQNSNWSQAINSEKEVVWSMWKEDRSCTLKNIILRPNLTASVFIELKEIILPETKKYCSRQYMYSIIRPS
ncbi:uncharacterized protein LOC127288901 [Leptopilina boulardi]|uniref:uncharacterized protein LOC127288901 n=1 Tax=Leptopilina boulardi TaxID=63433 RepID=UPI0021F51B88|nr:uncharacterized protein LOC127288901 [Leptopilina boulardi]